MQAYANALLVIPKTLAVNGGFDAQETMVKLVEERQNAGDVPVGIDLNSGEPAQPIVSLLGKMLCFLPFIRGLRDSY